MTFAATVWLITRKDLLIEARSREILYTTIFFAVGCVLVFAFGFVREGRAVTDAAAGILWIAIAFSGTLALGRAFERTSLGAELWGVVDDDPAGRTHQASFDLTAARGLGQNAQLDAGLNLGLTRATPDVELYVGVARRF